MEWVGVFFLVGVFFWDLKTYLFFCFIYVLFGMDDFCKEILRG